MKVFRLAKAIVSNNIKGHFGQWAEDVLVRKLFPKNKNTGTYLDLGAYHPFKHSNTAYFWIKGWCGFNIDANPNSIKLLNKFRPDDKNIWTAIIPQSDYSSGIRNVQLMLPSTKDSTSGISASGTVHASTSSERSFSESLNAPAISVNALLDQYSIGDIDYLNVDIEGYDLTIIREFDFLIRRPSVISIEDYSNNLHEVLSSEITTILLAAEYELVGRAGPTSIFMLSK